MTEKDLRSTLEILLDSAFKVGSCRVAEGALFYAEMAEIVTYEEYCFLDCALSVLR